MINFQRIIDKYKENKRKILNATEKGLTDWISDLSAKEKPPYLRLSKFVSLGMLVTGMEKDLGKEIPLLRKTKEKMRDAKQHFHEKNFALAVKNFQEARKYLLEFKEKEFEKILTTILRKSLKKVQL